MRNTAATDLLETVPIPIPERAESVAALRAAGDQTVEDLISPCHQSMEQA